MSENQSGGVSRRDLLKKGAVAGGIVWTAPVVLSGVAGAQTAGGSVVGCTTKYFAKLPANGSGVINGNVSSCESGIGEKDCLDGVNGYAKGDSSIQSGCAAIVGIDTTTNTVYLAATIGGATIQNVLGYTKAANNACGAPIAGTAANSATYPTAAWQVTFPASNGGNATSHVEIAFCA